MMKYKRFLTAVMLLVIFLASPELFAQGITKEMTIEKIIELCPKAAEIMFVNGMHCVGCHVAASESLEDGAKSHGLSDEQIAKMIDEMNKLVDK